MTSISVKPVALALLPALLACALFPLRALACGACIEDKMAATYDYASVQKAHAAGKTVVFCDVQNRIDEKTLRRVVSATPGVDAGSIRISQEPAALSFALDTRQQSPEAAVAAITQRLHGKARVRLIRSDPASQPAKHTGTAPHSHTHGNTPPPRH